MGKIIGAIILAVLIIPLFVILATFLSGVAGMIIGWAFPFVTDTLRQSLNVYLTDFQIGATLGFFGSFFRSNNFGSSK